jgi:phenylpropionate dioxygenase-like ring-hydroxylating dioxygenase large terminal subunit
MGNLMREYWLPAALSSEFPRTDSEPVRIRLLGENLIGYRVTSGRIGLIQNACPHRGASMFFGRNEEEGIRCVYHGWKFDIDGHCVDMPSEPELTQAKNRLKFASYPCVERGGVVWAYMGPRETPPPLPDLEGNMVEGSTVIRASLQYCNWLQSVENNADTTHAGFLHFGAVSTDSPREAWEKYPAVWDLVAYRSAKFHTIDRENGASYAAERPVLGDEENTINWRIMNWHFPFYTQIPSAKFSEPGVVTAVVPVDDTHTMIFEMGQSAEALGLAPEVAGVQISKVLPNTTGWYGRFRPAVTLDDDLAIDREAQRHERHTTRGFTGIAEGQDQDRGITESQGEIHDRTTENLRSTDRMIHMIRSRLMQAAIALRDHDTAPPGVDHPEAYRQRSGNVTLPKGADVWESTKAQREQFEWIVEPSLA